MEEFKSASSVSDGGLTPRNIFGQGLADSYLSRDDLSMPNDVDVKAWIHFVQDSVDDRDRPFKNYNGPSIQSIVRGSGVDMGKLIDCVMDKCEVAERTVYRWIKDANGAKAAPGKALVSMVFEFARYSESAQKAWWAIASVCLGCCESDEEAYSNIEFAKQKAIADLAYSLHGTELDSLYICAMAYKDAFKARRGKNDNAQDAVDRVDLKNSLWWAKH